MKLDKLVRHYRGEIAESYEALRSNAKWLAEQKAVSELLRSMDRSITVLDVPVGTGRFLPLYEELGFRVTGMDVSADMLTEARKKIREDCSAVTLRICDIRQIDADADSFDCVICMRFLNWIDAPLLATVLAELRRVSKRNLIVGIRHYIPVKEFNPLSSTAGFFRAISQLWHLSWRKGELIVHQKSQINDILSKLGLRIIEAKLIEANKRGTTYYIYLLEK